MFIEKKTCLLQKTDLCTQHFNYVWVWQIVGMANCKILRVFNRIRLLSQQPVFFNETGLCTSLQLFLVVACVNYLQCVVVLRIYKDKGK